MSNSELLEKNNVSFAKKSVMEGHDSNSIHHVSHEHFCCMGLWVAPVSFDGGDKGNGDSLNFLFQRCVSLGDIFLRRRIDINSMR